MKTGTATRSALLVVLLTTFPAAAQLMQQEPARWHLRGTFGMGYTQSNYQGIGAGSGSSDYLNALADLGLSTQGFLFDPKFLTLDAGFQGQRGFSSIPLTSFNTDLLGYNLSSTFLPASNTPLHVTYYRSNFDTSTQVVGSANRTSGLSLEWSTRYRSLPRFNVFFNRNTNSVKLPTSLTDTGFTQRNFGLQADDVRAGWHWNAAFVDNLSNTNTFGGLSLQSFDTRLRSFSGLVSRSFWGEKATLNLESRADLLHSQLQGNGTQELSTYYETAQFVVRHTRKLTSQYSYSFVRTAFAGGTATGPITFVNGQSADTHSIGGEVSYQVWQPVRVIQSLRYYRLTPVTPQIEERNSFTESLSTVLFNRRLRAFDIAASYTARVNLITTDLHHSNHTLSNDFDTRVTWGDVRRFRLTGTARRSQLNLVDQIGGFTEDQRYGAQVETAALPQVRLRGSVERGSVDLLNSAGKITSRYTNFLAQVEHRRFAVSAARTLSDGSSALFPFPLSPQDFLSKPLPVSQLVFSPLLDRTTHATTFAATAFLKRNLDLNASYRRENSLFAVSSQLYRTYDLGARYRLGKVTLEAGLGNYRSTVEQSQKLTGIGINRYYFRIRRDFTVF
jgi:hypothetical protein